MGYILAHTPISEWVATLSTTVAVAKFPFSISGTLKVFRIEPNVQEALRNPLLLFHDQCHNKISPWFSHLHPSLLLNRHQQASELSQSVEAMTWPPSAVRLLGKGRYYYSLIAYHWWLDFTNLVRLVRVFRALSLAYSPWRKFQLLWFTKASLNN